MGWGEGATINIDVRSEGDVLVLERSVGGR